MKKRMFAAIAALVISVFGATSCIYEEKSDVDITFSIAASDSNYDGPEDLATVVAGLAKETATVLDAFTAAFNATGLEPLGSSNHWVLRDQTSNKKAESIATDAGAKGNAKLSGFKLVYYSSLSIEVNVRSSFGDKTVARYDYSK